MFMFNFDLEEIVIIKEDFRKFLILKQEEIKFSVFE